MTKRIYRWKIEGCTPPFDRVDRAVKFPKRPADLKIPIVLDKERESVVSYRYDSYSSNGEKFCNDYAASYYDDYAIGKLTEVEDPSGKATYCYDKRGRTVAEQKIVNGIDTPFVTAWTYYDNDAVKTLTYPDNYVVTYGYKEGQLNSVWEDTDKDGVIDTTETAYVRSFEYNSESQIELIELGNGLYTDYTYDLEGGSLRLQSIVTCDAVTASGVERFCSTDSNKIQNMVYEYDPVGNILSIADIVENETQRFTYDDLYRLTCGDVYPADLSSNPGTCGTDPDSNDGLGLTYQRYYGYDAIGNMRTNGDNVEGFTWVYFYDETEGAGPHAVTRIVANEVETYNFYYDSNGNTISIPDINWETPAESKIRETTWDFENRMSSLVVKSLSGAEEIEMDFTYDESGWRVIKENETTGEFTVYLDKLFEVGYEDGDSGVNNFATKYIFAGGRRIAHVKNDYEGSSNGWTSGPLLAGSVGLPWGGGISFDPAVGTIALALLLLLLPYGIARWGFRRWVPVRIRLREGVVVASLLVVIASGLFVGLGGIRFHAMDQESSVVFDYDQETLDHMGKVRTPSVGVEGKVYLP
jgi:YD repeat-containing protein